MLAGDKLLATVVQFIFRFGKKDIETFSDIIKFRRYRFFDLPSWRSSGPEASTVPLRPM